MLPYRVFTSFVSTLTMHRPAPSFRGRRSSVLASLLGVGSGVGAMGSGALGWVAAALHCAPARAASAAASPSALAPDFTLRGVGSPTLRLAEQRGQVVMLNFWASWAGASKLELPQLNRLFGTYRRDGLLVWGVNLDTDPAVAQAFAQRIGLLYPQLHDTEKTVARQYALETLPATVLIDRDGQLRYAFRGWRDGQDALYEQHIRELVKE
jgi:peroxiredoxin